MSEFVTETGKMFYNVYLDEGDGVSDSDEPLAVIPDNDQADNIIIAIDSSDKDVIIEDTEHIDQHSGIYGSLCEVVGTPVTREQENILLVGSVGLLILGCYAMFKIVNYLFHI